MPEIAKNKIESKILKSSRGELFFADDFKNFATPENIRVTLFRLENDGLIERMAHGIYIKPKEDPLLGTIYPNIGEVAKEIAKRDKARIAPTGVMALYLLGLTTQVPLKAVYLTDGSQREVKIGNRTIKFKRTVPKSFAIKDELLQLIVQAFKEKGQQDITAEFLETIRHAVKKLDEKMIQNQVIHAPVWIQKQINNLYQS
ncbi:DUF6088 family protein [Niabella terrae]